MKVLWLLSVSPTICWSMQQLLMTEAEQSFFLLFWHFRYLKPRRPDTPHYYDSMQGVS